ncbi:hypothetical protein J6590_076131 [Homalodisca vitripennis]|nr:hypothetical protein J6590_076131 [Homalodisca vitripennis]
MWFPTKVYAWTRELQQLPSGLSKAERFFDERYQHCSRQVDKEATARRTTVVNDQWVNGEILKTQEEDTDLKYLLTWMRSGKGIPAWQEVAPLSLNIKTLWAL